MIEKQLGGMSPVKLRITLIVMIAVLILLSAVGFWFFRGWLESYATKVNSDAKQAEVSSTDISTLQRLKTQLEDEKVAVNRTKNIVADSKSYEYQNQIVGDLNNYAKASGVSLAGYGFTSNDGTSGSTGATPQASTTPAPAGLKTTSITVTIKNPVKYESIMNFIHSIESNLTKMQLTGISLRQDQSGGDMVTVEPLTVEVFIR